MNNHLTDEQIVAHYYRDPAVHDYAQQHLAVCETCHAAYAQVSGVLGAVKSAPAPEPLHGFEERMWRKVHGRIRESRRPQLLSFPAHHWAYALGITAAVAAAFFLGRLSPREPVSQVAQGSPGNVKERILLITVADHLDRSQVMLLELVNASEGDSLAVDRERAADLVADNRLFRQVVARDGDHATAAVLEDLERVLMEIENAPDSVGRDELQNLRAAIEDKGLLLKVRVVGSQARERVNHPRRDSIQSVI